MGSKHPTHESDANDQKEPTLVLQEEPVQESDELLLLDPALQRKLALLEPPESHVPAAMDALEAFRKAHYPREAKTTPWQRFVAWWTPQRPLLMGLAGVACGLALMLSPDFLFTTEAPTPSRDRTPATRGTPRPAGVYTGKGLGSWAMLYAKAGALMGSRVRLTRRASMDQRLAPRDLIQFVYQLPKAQHVMVLNIDQKGALTVCVPFQGASSVQMASGRGTIPPRASMELDHNTGHERFVVLQASQAFTLKQVKRAFRASWKQARRDVKKLTTLPGPWHAHSFLIHKQAPTTRPHHE